MCVCICMYVEIAVETRCVKFPWSCTCRQLWTARCGLEEEQALLLSHLFRPLPQLSKRKAAWAWRMLKLGWREFREPLHSSVSGLEAQCLPYCFYCPRPQAFTLFVRILDLPQTFSLTWQMPWGAQVLTSETAVYVVGAASQKRTLMLPMNESPVLSWQTQGRHVLSNIQESLLISREQWLEIFQTWWHG